MERDQAIKHMRELLRLMVEKGCSDMFITEGYPPALKLHGDITPASDNKLTSKDTKALVYAVMNDKQLKEYEATKECNFAVSPLGIGRFRVNVYYQRGHCAMVLRTIETDVPDLDGLGLPNIMKDVAMSKRGLVIMAGGTGSGKTTSLAAMINYRNESAPGHIITIEDPIEFIHPHKRCIVTQREIGLDTDDWSVALKNSLRQAPDVILLGEIRDRETMEMGVTFSETGHLAMATLHANSANQVLDRVINFFPDERRQQLLMDLSLNLKAVIAQRMIRSSDGSGSVVAMEIMLNSPLISELILKNKVHEIKDIMSRSRELGMQTFDQALFDLYEGDRVKLEDALRNADSINELRLKIKLEGKNASTLEEEDLDHMSLEKKEDKEAARRFR